MESRARSHESCISSHCLERLEERIVLDVYCGWEADYSDGVENYYWYDDSTGEAYYYDYIVDGYNYVETSDGGATFYFEYERYVPDTTDGFSNEIWWDSDGYWEVWDYDATGFLYSEGDGVDSSWLDVHWYPDASDGYENWMLQDSSGYWEIYDFDADGYWYFDELSPTPVWFADSHLDNWYADTGDGWADFYFSDGGDYYLMDGGGRDAEEPLWGFCSVTHSSTIASWGGFSYTALEGVDPDYTDGWENYYSANSFGEAWYENNHLNGYVESWTSVNGVSGIDTYNYTIPDFTDGFANEAFSDSFGNWWYEDPDATGYDYSESWAGVFWMEGYHEYENTDGADPDYFAYDSYGWILVDNFASGTPGQGHYGYFELYGSYADGSQWWEGGYWIPDPSDGYDDYLEYDSSGWFEYYDYDALGYWYYEGANGWFDYERVDY